MQSPATVILSELRGYSAKDISRADDFCVTYKMAPSTTAANAKCASRKKRKKASMYLLA